MLAALPVREARQVPRWRLDADRALLALAQRGEGRAGATAEFEAAWARLEKEPALPPVLRRRFRDAAP